MTVDLRSDTVTRPTAAMREAMANALVGDDVMNEDPTVNLLQEEAARVLGKEAALFVPSGTMANLLAVMSQTRPGDAVILHEDSHPVHYESGNLAMLAGVMTRTVRGACGILDVELVESALDLNPDHHHAHTTMIEVENTSNRGGGSLYPLETMAALHKLTKENGIRLHCDGARLFNAAVASGVSAAEYARHADTVSCCFSKGLGAPVGSILAGDAATVDRAHRFRKMVGGGMRQAGVIAAGALYALRNNVDRLSEDHRRAAAFRATLENMPGVSFPLPSPTNIVYMDVMDAEAMARELAVEDVLTGALGPHRLRAVFHLDVDDVGLEQAVATFRKVVGLR